MSDKKMYTIFLHGCDDTTPIYIELSEDEVKLIHRLAEMSEEASTRICMPILEIQAGKVELDPLTGTYESDNNQS